MHFLLNILGLECFLPACSFFKYHSYIFYSSNLDSVCCWSFSKPSLHLWIPNSNLSIQPCPKQHLCRFTIDFKKQGQAPQSKKKLQTSPDGHEVQQPHSQQTKIPFIPQWLLEQGQQELRVIHIRITQAASLWSQGCSRGREGWGSSTSSCYQLLLNGLVALPQELLGPLEDPVLRCNFCYFQSLLFVKRVLAPELVHVLLELGEREQELTSLTAKQGLTTASYCIKCNYPLCPAH